MKIKYLEEFNKEFIDYKEFFENPTRFLEKDIINLNTFSRRKELIAKYAWAVPTQEAIEKICEFSPIIEIGAGGGYWAYLIKKNGGEIIAFDNYSTHQEKEYKKWFDVKNGSYEKLKTKKYSKHILFLCWSSYDNNIAFNCLKHYQGEYLLYIGEIDGCTANEKFFDELDKNWKLKEVINIPSFWGVKDNFYIYKKNKMRDY